MDTRERLLATAIQMMRNIDAAADAANHDNLKLAGLTLDDPRFLNAALLTIAQQLSYANTIRGAEFYMRHVEPYADE